MEELQLKAFSRSDTGKCPARRLRKTGMIPAILYGSRTESMKLTVNASELKRLLVQKADKKFFRLLIEGDGNTVEKISIVKKFDMHPLGNQLIHADFYEINMDEKISVVVPVHLIGTPVGVELGGELQQHKRELRLSCLPKLLPEGIDIDIRPLKVGDALKIKDIQLAEGIAILEAEDATVVFVAATRAAIKAIDEQAGAAAGQPEVLKQKAPEKKGKEKKK